MYTSWSHMQRCYDGMDGSEPPLKSDGGVDASASGAFVRGRLRGERPSNSVAEGPLTRGLGMATMHSPA
jgi:hypothetical protein